MAENEELKRQLEILRKQVEDEALANTALHNQNQSLKEDYEFLKKTHEGVCLVENFLNFYRKKYEWT